MTKPHTEKAFEDAVEEHLVEHGGYQRGSSDNYDRERALLSDDDNLSLLERKYGHANECPL